MSATADIEVQSTELPRTLIRNGCVNTGEKLPRPRGSELRRPRGFLRRLGTLVRTLYFLPGPHEFDQQD